MDDRIGLGMALIGVITDIRMEASRYSGLGRSLLRISTRIP